MRGPIDEIPAPGKLKRREAIAPVNSSQNLIVTYLLEVRLSSHSNHILRQPIHGKLGDSLVLFQNLTVRLVPYINIAERQRIRGGPNDESATEWFEKDHLFLTEPH